MPEQTTRHPDLSQSHMAICCYHNLKTAVLLTAGLAPKFPLEGATHDLFHHDFFLSDRCTSVATLSIAKREICSEGCLLSGKLPTRATANHITLPIRGKSNKERVYTVGMDLEIDSVLEKRKESRA